MDRGHTSAFGTQLRRARRAAGLTQEEVAERAGISVRAISDLERGVHHSPHTDTVARLTKTLGLHDTDRAAFAAGVGRLRASTALVSSAQGMTPMNTGSDASPFVGRQRELALLEAHLAGQGPPMLLLAGEPGIGKSSLLREAATLARSGGWQVLSGGCTRRGGQEPFAPLVQALHDALQACPSPALRAALQGCAWLVRMLPELADAPLDPLPPGAISPAQERRLVFAAVARLLHNVRGPAGTLLLLDDLQWAGQDALDLLATLFTGADSGLRMLGAYRSNEVPPTSPPHPLDAFMAEAADAVLVAHHPIAPLPPAEARALLLTLDSSGSALPMEMQDAVLSRAEGVPFFLISFAWALQQETRPELGQLPWHIRQSIRRRIAVLPVCAQDLMRVAAVLGRTSPYPILAAAANMSERTLLQALAAACNAALLTEVGDAYSFVHDVVRETVVEGLGLGERRALHRRVAEAWEGHLGFVPVEALAFHYRQAGDSEQAVRFLLLAGERAGTRYAHAAVAEHYRDAAECLLELGRLAEAAHTQERQGEALALLGQYDKALQVLDPARRTFEEVGDFDGLGRILHTYWLLYERLGRLDQLPDLLRPVLGRIEYGGPSGGLAWLYLTLISDFVGSAQYRAAMSLVERLDRVVQALEDPVLPIYVELWRGSLLHLLRCNDEAMPVLERALQRVEALENPDYMLLSTASYKHIIAASAYFISGRFPDAFRHGRTALAQARRFGDPWHIAMRLASLGHMAVYSGDWHQARQNLDEALEVSRGVESSRARAGVLWQVGYLHLLRGDFPAAGVALRESQAIAVPTGGEAIWSTWLLAELDLFQGHAEEARARLLPLVDRATGPDAHDAGGVLQLLAFILPRLAWAYLQLREFDEAERIVTWARSYAEEEGNKVALVEALRIQALLRGEQQRWPEAEVFLEDALTLARPMPYPYAEGRLLYARALLHVRQGDYVTAREHLDAGLAIFRRLGAYKDVELAEELLTAPGCLADSLGGPDHNRPIRSMLP